MEHYWKKYHSKAPEDKMIFVEEGKNLYDMLELLLKSRSIENILKICGKICDKTDTGANLNRYIDINHIHGAIYEWEGCREFFRLDQDLQRHMTCCIQVIFD